MPQRLVLLCEPLPAPHLEQFVRDRAPDLDVRLANHRVQLQQAIEDAPRATRLLAFCASTIVPKSVLRRLDLTPYNIHPGPPAYPGVHPDAFAHADGSATYGATAHELTARIDGGAIIAFAECDIPLGAARTDYADLGFACGLDLFRVIVQHCLASDADFPRHPSAEWCGPYNTLQAYHARFGHDPAANLLTTS